MKHSPAQYADAFLQAVAGKPGEIVNMAKRLVKFAVKNGDASQLPKILEAVQKMETKQSGGRMVLVELARELSPDAVKQIKQSFDAKDQVKVKVNPTLIAGMRVTIDGEWVLDTSFEKKLKKLFV